MKYISDNKSIIIFLVLLIFMIFRIYNNNVLEKKELHKITGMLKNTPYFEEGGPDTNDYIGFNIVNDMNNYYIMNCSYRACKKDDILKLKAGDTVTFYVKIKEPKYGAKFIKVFSLSINNKYLLSLKNYNKCNYSSQRRILFFSFIIFLIILCKIIIDFYKTHKN